MTQQLTPGRWRGLKTASLQGSDIFGILAFDQRGSYHKMLPDNTPYERAVQIKREVVVSLSRYASAILLDPVYGLEPAMHMNGKSGLLMAIEASGYSGDATYRKLDFLDGWTVEKIRNMGASAVKILIYYNPQAAELADELDEIAADVVRDCHALDLPIFIEPMSYSIDSDVATDSAEFAAQKAEIVVETARRLAKTGADVLKMEFPVNYKFTPDESEWRKQCEALSAAVEVPWVLLSAGVDFETFERQTIIACEAGASGFLAGRAIWKEAINLSDDERKTFLDTTAKDRILRLIDVAENKACPWSDFYAPPIGGETWYQ